LIVLMKDGSAPTKSAHNFFTVGAGVFTFMAGIGLGFALHRQPARAPSATPGGEGALEPAAETGGGPRGEARNPGGTSAHARLSTDAVAEEAARRRAELQQQARTLVDDVSTQLLIEAKATAADSVEAAGFGMTQYLRGMVAGLRSNPELLTQVGEALAERTCSHPQSDLELVMVSQMVMAAPEVLAAPRTFDCALSGRTKEDVPLWSLVDAWRASGKPMPAAIAAIAASATDERTTRRLSNYEASMKERLAAGDRSVEAPNQEQR
jgi:hypothetical protein